jgi:hypothetical protein
MKEAFGFLFLLFTFTADCVCIARGSVVWIYVVVVMEIHLQNNPSHLKGHWHLGRRGMKKRRLIRKTPKRESRNERDRPCKKDTFSSSPSHVNGALIAKHNHQNMYVHEGKYRYEWMKGK